jgi:hypothetical protein
VNGLDISLNSTTYYECVSITSSKNGATVITNVSCSGTYTPPAKVMIRFEHKTSFDGKAKVPNEIDGMLSSG